MSDQNTTIKIWNVDDIELDRGMLSFALSKAAQHAPNANHIDIYTAKRNMDGWIEWLVCPKYRRGGSMTIGCIQRTEDSEYESHS